MYVHSAGSIQLNSISAATYVQRSAIEYIHQPHTFNAAQLGTFTNRVGSVQRNWVHSPIVYVESSAIEYILNSATEYIPRILSY